MLEFCVFGNPIKHSFSPRIHNATFLASGFQARYGRFLLPLDKSPCEFMHILKLQGANVTIPFKEIAFQTCDEVRGIAQKIGAVNTLKLENGRIIGFNTDAQGFFGALENLDSEIKNAFVLGAGGSARAVAFILRENEIDATIYNRSESRLEFFAQNGFECLQGNTLDSENFENLKFDLIINTTPAGLNDENLPLNSEILSKLFGRAKFAYDLIYGKQTPFLKMAQERNLRTFDGKQMLINQAALASEIFTDSEICFENARKIMQAHF